MSLSDVQIRKVTKTGATSSFFFGHFVESGNHPATMNGRQDGISAD